MFQVWIYLDSSVCGVSRHGRHACSCLNMFEPKQKFRQRGTGVEKMRKTARVIAQPCRYDRRQRQKVKYLAMDFRIKQAELWRDDISDLVSVTEQKMDNVPLVTYPDKMYFAPIMLSSLFHAYCESGPS